MFCYENHAGKINSANAFVFTLMQISPDKSKRRLLNAKNTLPVFLYVLQQVTVASVKFVSVYLG